DALRIISKNGIDILQVAHHGSSINTNDQEFLSVIKPKFAVISCGFNNSYGHPHTETLENLNLVGSRIFRTDQNGCVSILLK
ncbi:MAG: MBL fold metallo-hydrolase, partial [Lachnospiraceae bacterium]|nr:MBL fold metallo-hydrolase [Lachnospiraceae bacterium]